MTSASSRTGAGCLRQSCWWSRAAPRPARRSSAALYSPPDRRTVHGVPAEHGMVVAQEKLAAQIGADILRQGGNAVDAAVATGFAMAVTYPRAGNIGGGGFMVIHLGRAQRGRRHRLSRDRAGGDHARYFSGRRRQTRYRQVAQFRARHRRARHGRGTGAGAGKIRLGQFHAGADPEAGHRRWRVTALSSPTTSPTPCRTCTARMARWPNSAKGLFPRRRHAAARWRPA